MYLKPSIIFMIVLLMLFHADCYANGSLRSNKLQNQRLRGHFWQRAGRYINGLRRTRNFAKRLHQTSEMRTEGNCKRKRQRCCTGWYPHRITGDCLLSCVKSCSKHGKCVSRSKCLCDQGFTGIKCDQDINECASQPCSGNQACVNTFGSYKCICNDEACQKKDACQELNCQHRCIMRSGSKPKCACESGYELSNDEKRCLMKTVDTCIEKPCPSGRNCPEPANNCSCRYGYYYHRHLQYCTDSDECLIEEHDCDVTTSICVNTKGSYKCLCRLGYRIIGNKCKLMKFKRNAEHISSPKGTRLEKIFCSRCRLRYRLKKRKLGLFPGETLSSSSFQALFLATEPSCKHCYNIVRSGVL